MNSNEAKVKFLEACRAVAMKRGQPYDAASARAGSLLSGVRAVAERKGVDAGALAAFFTPILLAGSGDGDAMNAIAAVLAALGVDDVQTAKAKIEQMIGSAGALLEAFPELGALLKPGSATKQAGAEVEQAAQYGRRQPFGGAPAMFGSAARPQQLASQAPAARELSDAEAVAAAHDDPMAVGDNATDRPLRAMSARGLTKGLSRDQAFLKLRQYLAQGRAQLAARHAGGAR